MNHNILVEAKKEYTNQLQQVLKPRIYEGLKSMYEDTVSMIGREYIENGGQNGSVVKAFQKVLRDIPLWNQEMINRECERIISSSKCDYFEDLIETVFITNIKILSSVQINGTDPIGLSVNIPSTSHFIHKCYIESAKEIYKNPYVFETSKNLTPKEKHTNMRDALNYIEGSVNTAIRDLLPIRDILKHGIIKQSAGGEKNENMKEIEVSLKPSVISKESSKVSEESDDEEEEDVSESGQSGGSEVTEEEETEEENESEGDEEDESTINEELKSEVIEPIAVETLRTPLVMEGGGAEIQTPNPNPTNLMEMVPEKRESSTASASGGGFHLFDKLSKVFNGEPKPVENTISQQIPQYNNVKPVVDESRPPEIKEIFIGKHNQQHLSSQHLLKKKPQRSLYEKKYDEYVRNSEIKSSSIKPSRQSSSVSRQPSKQSISGISTSKTIILEDASEYVSDNVDF